jgi:D-alanine-D-alanine ligase-like ATP-grasp enzyme
MFLSLDSQPSLYPSAEVGNARVESLTRSETMATVPARLQAQVIATSPYTRRVLVGLDILQSAGVRYAWRRFAHDRSRSRLNEGPRNEVYERIWREAAGEIDADVAALGNGFLEVRTPADARTVVRQQVVKLDDALTLRIALDRTIVYRLLAECGIPPTPHVTFDARSIAKARDFLERQEGGCVVKPASGTGGGLGITSGVRTVGVLTRATLRASRFSSEIMIEKQFAGDAYRLLFLDGDLLDIVRRRSPSVLGDGRSTIRKLIERENQRRAAARGEAGLEPLRIDLDCILALRNQGLRLTTVPQVGATVTIKTVSNQGRIEDNETVREPPSPDLVSSARAAAAAVGLRLAGVDIVTSDISRSLSDERGGVIEVNGTPGLHHHYHVADRQSATRVAVPILRTLLEPAGASDQLSTGDRR